MCPKHSIIKVETFTNGKPRETHRDTESPEEDAADVLTTRNFRREPKCVLALTFLILNLTSSLQFLIRVVIVRTWRLEVEVKVEVS